MESPHPEISSISPSHIVPAGKGPQAEAVGTRIYRIDVARSGRGQAIGGTSVDSKHVVTVDSVSRERTRLRGESGELPAEDLGHAGGTTLDGEEPVMGRCRSGMGHTSDGEMSHSTSASRRRGLDSP